MDSETLFSSLEHLGSSGVILSVEQKASLQSSLVTIQREHKFRRVKLWGIIRGVQKDYFIVQGVGKNELHDRKALYSQDCISWHLLPHATAENKNQASLIEGRFTGDPSFDYEHTVTHKVGDADTSELKPTTITMKEEVRLAAVVSTIDAEVAVVPRGAYVKAPLGDVVLNRSYRGLSLADANRLNYYMHFRPPMNKDNITVPIPNTITRSIEFLDTIDHDIPKGCWSIQCDQGGSCVILRNLIWMGMLAYVVPDSTSFGYFYCGTGEKNPDILFML